MRFQVFLLCGGIPWRETADFDSQTPECLSQQTYLLVLLLQYYGWYSNRMRGDRKRQQGLSAEGSKSHQLDLEVINIKKFRPKRIPQLMWRECIKKVREVDPLICPKCTGMMIQPNLETILSRNLKKGLLPISNRAVL